MVTLASVRAQTAPTAKTFSPSPFVTMVGGNVFEDDDFHFISFPGPDHTTGKMLYNFNFHSTSSADLIETCSTVQQFDCLNSASAIGQVVALSDTLDWYEDKETNTGLHYITRLNAKSNWEPMCYKFTCCTDLNMDMCTTSNMVKVVTNRTCSTNQDVMLSTDVVYHLLDSWENSPGTGVLDVTEADLHAKIIMQQDPRSPCVVDFTSCKFTPQVGTVV